MSKKGWIAFGFLAALVGGGFIAADRLLAASAYALVNQLQAGLPEGASFTHGELKTSLLHREVSLDSVDVKTPDGNFTAKRLVMRGLPWLSREQISVGQIELEDASFNGPFAMTAEHFRVDRPLLKVQEGQAQPQFSFQSATLGNFSFKRQDVNFSLSLPDLKVGAFEGNRLAHLEARAAEGTLPDNTGVPIIIRLESLAVDGFDLALLSAQTPLQLISPLMLQDSLRNLALDGFSMRREGKEGLSLDKFSFNGTGVSGTSRTELGVEVLGLKIAREGLPPEIADQLQAIGKEALEIRAEFGSKLELEDKRLVFQPLRITIPDMLEISLRSELGNVQSADQVANGVAMAAASLGLVEFHLKDLGFVKRRVDTQARLRGVSREDYVASEISVIAPARGGGGPQTERLAKAFQNFMLNSGELVLVARPSEPLSLMQMFFLANRPESLLEKLGVFVTVNNQD